MPKNRDQFNVPPEARPSAEQLQALDGKVLTNRDAIDPEGWNRVEDGLPPCPTMKPTGLCWDVFDPVGRVRVSTIHPANWNLALTHIEGGLKVVITEVVTHWRDRPKPPE